MANSLGSVAFIGLGVMGFPMAGHLAKSASAVTVYNRNTSRATQWLEAYGESPAQCAMAATPRDAAAEADVVFVCVGNDHDVTSVVLGENGALAGMSGGSMLVDHTTASKQLAQTLADACGDRQVVPRMAR
jgi:3-hydroxyisobutyrate dehydrogenase